MDEATKKAVIGAITPILASAAVTLAVTTLMSSLKSFLVTNQNKHSLEGNKRTMPTQSETILAKEDASGSEVDSSLSNDEVTAQGGDLSAAETEAKAATSEATAAEGGASAVRTKAGASDIETKALKMT